MSTPLDLSTYQRADGTWVMTVSGLVTVDGLIGEPGSG